MKPPRVITKSQWYSLGDIEHQRLFELFVDHCPTFAEDRHKVMSYGDAVEAHTTYCLRCITIMMQEREQ